MRRYAQRSLLLVAVLAMMTGCSSEPTYYAAITSSEEGNAKLEKITGEQDALWQNTLASNDEFGLKNFVPRRTYDISKDGTRVGFIGEKGSPKTNVFIRELTGNRALLQRTFRDDVMQMSFSPDGKWIVYTDMRDRGSNIFVTDAFNGVATRQITTGQRICRSPIFSQDGKSVIYTEVSGNFELWQFGLDDGKLMQFGRGADVDFIPGTQRAVITRPVPEEFRSEVWIVDFQSGQEFSLLADKDRTYCLPAISPDGKRLLVTGTTPETERRPSNYDVYMVDLDGQNLRQLTFHYGHDIAPRWARDGKSFYFLSQRGNREGKWNIWQMQLR